MLVKSKVKLIEGFSLNVKDWLKLARSIQKVKNSQN